MPDKANETLSLPLQENGTFKSLWFIRIYYNALFSPLTGLSSPNGKIFFKCFIISLIALPFFYFFAPAVGAVYTVGKINRLKDFNNFIAALPALLLSTISILLALYVSWQLITPFYPPEVKAIINLTIILLLTAACSVSASLAAIAAAIATHIPIQEKHRCSKILKQFIYISGSYLPGIIIFALITTVGSWFIISVIQWAWLHYTGFLLNYLKLGTDSIFLQPRKIWFIIAGIIYMGIMSTGSSWIGSTVTASLNKDTDTESPSTTNGTKNNKNEKTQEELKKHKSYRNKDAHGYRKKIY